jgi:hypothetical protein
MRPLAHRHELRSCNTNNAMVEHKTTVSCEFISQSPFINVKAHQGRRSYTQKPLEYLLTANMQRSSDTSIQLKLQEYLERQKRQNESSLHDLYKQSEDIKRETSLSSAERQRRLGVICSRRKRLRQNQKVLELEQECANFRLKNLKLRDDNILLEAILNEAQSKLQVMDQQQRTDQMISSVSATSCVPLAAAFACRERPGFVLPVHASDMMCEWYPQQQQQPQLQLSSLLSMPAMYHQNLQQQQQLQMQPTYLNILQNQFATTVDTHGPTHSLVTYDEGRSSDNSWETYYQQSTAPGYQYKL